MTNSPLAPDYIASLPSEVLLTIFGAQESFRDISALFRTCKSLYTLWQTRAYSISKTILIRQTPCYSDVEALALAHEAAAHPATKSQTTLLLVDPSTSQKLQRTINKVILSRQIAQQAKCLCEMIETRYLQQKYHCHDAKCRARPCSLQPHERDAITRAHHFIKLYALTYTSTNITALHSHCKTKLGDMGVEDKHFILQLARIMHDYAFPWDKMRLGICNRFSSTGEGEFVARSEWSWYERFEAVKKAAMVDVATCRGCIYDDTARFSGLEQAERN